jgi:hypothetical protein
MNRAGRIRTWQLGVMIAVLVLWEGVRVPD